MENSTRDTLIEQALSALHSGNTAQAYEYCSTALGANDADAEAWSIMGMTLAGSQQEQSFAALQRAVQLEPHEPRWHIHLGLGFTYAGQPQQAEPVFRRAAQLSNYAPDAVLPWSNCLLELGMSGQAISALKQAADINPSPPIYAQLSKALTASNDFLGAVSAKEASFKGRDIPRSDMIEIINMHVMLGQYGHAQTYVDKILIADDKSPDIVLLAANLMRWRGELGQAHDLLSSAYGANDKDAELLLALLDLNKGKDARHIEQAKFYLKGQATPLTTRRRLAFVLARLADKSGRYDEAWHYAQMANGLYDDEAVSDVPLYKQQLAIGLELYDLTKQEMCEKDAAHIYVLGPPRSGGSLLQTILAAHPNLVSVGERGALMSWLLPILTQSRSNEEALLNWNSVAADLPLADTSGMRRSYPGSNKQVFVDKMPHHAHVAGLLHKLHPRSQFIDVRRDPYDITMSILFHDFSDKFGYSRNVGDIAWYLDFQRSAINSWQNVGLPIHIHNHQEFLDNPEQQGQSLFGNLGLNWKDSFLEPENRQSTVRTFSALQVRSKVTKAYSGRGKNYSEFMGSTADQLQKLASG